MRNNPSASSKINNLFLLVSTFYWCVSAGLGLLIDLSDGKTNNLQVEFKKKIVLKKITWD